MYCGRPVVKYIMYCGRPVVKYIMYCGRPVVKYIMYCGRPVVKYIMYCGRPVVKYGVEYYKTAVFDDEKASCPASKKICCRGYKQVGENCVGE